MKFYVKPYGVVELGGAEPQFLKVALLVLGLEILTWPCVCVRGPGLVPGPEEDQVHQVPHRPQHQDAGAKAGEQRHLFHKEKNNHSQGFIINL